MIRETYLAKFFQKTLIFKDFCRKFFFFQDSCRRCKSCKDLVRIWQESHYLQESSKIGVFCKILQHSVRILHYLASCCRNLARILKEIQFAHQLYERSLTSNGVDRSINAVVVTFSSKTEQKLLSTVK